MLGLYKVAGSHMSNSLLFIIEGNLNKAFKINVRYFEKKKKKKQVCSSIHYRPNFYLDITSSPNLIFDYMVLLEYDYTNHRDYS